VEISHADGTTLVLDAGTGILGLGHKLDGAYQNFNLLLTHLHMDHLQGMGFFSPFFHRSSEVKIWGPASTILSLRARLARYLSPPLFPVTMRDLPCKLVLNEVPCEPFNIGPFGIACDLIGHVGPTVGYRIETSTSVVTYMPDHEPALGSDNFSFSTEWTSGFDLAHGADLLIHDSQYSSEEYANRIGWGHSAIQDTLRFAKMCEVKHLVTFHHDPFHTDEQLDELFNEAIQAENPQFKVTAAREGAEFEL
jgi:ribonuclease BN (tRNA processing enzyme)